MIDHRLISASCRRFLRGKGIHVPDHIDIAGIYRTWKHDPLLLQQLLSEYSSAPVYNPLLHGSAKHPEVRLLCLKRRARYYLHAGIVPLDIRQRRIILGVVNPDIQRSPEAHALTKGFKPEYVLMTPVQCATVVDLVFSDVHARKATELLREKLPFYSACRPARAKRTLLAASALALLPLTAPLWPAYAALQAFYMFAAACYVIAFGMKTAVFIAGLRQPRTRYAPLNDADLPVCSVLAPVYKEPDILPQLLRALCALDYPKDKLDIVLVVEEDDRLTRDVLEHTVLPPHIRTIAVPASQPRTKPKACNYVLPLLRGDTAVIFDAEDIPGKMQLREAAAAFAHGDKACVTYQAPLHFYNGGHNLLTRWFALEYSGHFEYFLRGIAVSGTPLPLGGTSNHFRYDALARAGGWDPFNVTEDADLGIRLYARRKSAGILCTPTMEKAPETYGAWIRQRSRWIKGHMQTALVHSRLSSATLGRIGYKRFFMMHAFITVPILCYLSAPLLLFIGGLHTAICISDAADICMAFAAVPPQTLTILLPVAYVTQCIISLYAIRHTVMRGGGLAAYTAALLSPFYWVLHSIAAYKALWQLITKPYYWEKTVHGSRLRITRTMK